MPDNGYFHISGWRMIDNFAFISFALGIFLGAYIFGLASIATTWVTIPVSLRSLLLSWAPLWEIIGIAIAGPLSDKIGRKHVFYITMAMYGIGAVGIAFSYSYVLILLFLAILLIGGGGEMNTILAFAQEILPSKHRSTAMLLLLNFIALGGLVLGAISLSTAYYSIEFERGMIGITIIAVVVVLIVTRRYLPESFLWLASKGKEKQAKEEAIKYYGQEGYIERTESSKDLKEAEKITENKHIGLKLFATITTAFAGTTGFGLIAYVLAPTFFPSLTAVVLLVSDAAAFIVGFVGFFGEKISRRHMLLWGYVFSLVFTIIIYFTIGTWTKYLIVFWFFVIALNAFIQLGYMAEDTLKSEVWATKSRGSITALVRFLGIGLYIPTIYLTANYTLSQYILFNIIVWIIGSAGAIAWFVFGKETGKGLPIELAD
ncbi:MAG: MFS transporter [Ferroplasma sp.]